MPEKGLPGSGCQNEETAMKYRAGDGERSRGRGLAAAALLVAAGVLAAASSPAVAEVFRLANGGRIDGEWLNADEQHPQQYLVRLPSGGKITLAAAQVKEVVKLSPDEVEYEKIRPQYPDTADGQWKLAQWCLEHKLKEQRQTHLQRVIEWIPITSRPATPCTRARSTASGRPRKRPRRSWAIGSTRAMAVGARHRDCRDQTEDGTGREGVVPEAQGLAAGWAARSDREARDKDSGVTDPAAVRRWPPI